MEICKNCMQYSKCSNERINAVMNVKAIYCGDYRDGWISVENCLPNKDAEVLVYSKSHLDGLMNVYTYMGDNEWEDDYGYWQSTEDARITHWMPLPLDPTV